MRQDFHKQHMELTVNQIYFLLFLKIINLTLPMSGEVGHLHEILLEQTIGYSSDCLVFFFFLFCHSRIFLNITLKVIFLPSLRINKKKTKSCGEDLLRLF